MIHDIQNPTQALATLHEIAKWDPNNISWWELDATAHFTTVFNLDESLDPNDIPTCLSQCKTCDLIVNFKTDQQHTTECPQCQGVLEVIAIAELIIQGSVVVWREQCWIVMRAL